MNLFQNIENTARTADTKLVQEGLVPIEVLMTLDQILQDGKITNPAQTMILTNLIHTFSTGGITERCELRTSSAPVETVNHIKTMEDAAVVELTSYIQSLLLQKNDVNSVNELLKPGTSAIEWMNFVLAHQD